MEVIVQVGYLHAVRTDESCLVLDQPVPFVQYQPSSNHSSVAPSDQQHMKQVYDAFKITVYGLESLHGHLLHRLRQLVSGELLHIRGGREGH